LLSIAQNQALFALIGSQYGGDGVSNFAVPNLTGNKAMTDANGAPLTWTICVNVIFPPRN
jgi:microcystin-dependent protein